MTAPTNWPHPDQDPELYMRHQEKRILHEQRRPSVRKASDILGAGFAPLATRIEDWSDDVTAFNGYWWSAGDADNAPSNTGASAVWLGTTVSMGAQGIEQAFNPSTGLVYQRQWTLIAGVRVYGDWVGFFGYEPWTAVTFNAPWTNYGLGYQEAQYRLVGDEVQLRGVVKDGTSGTVVFTLPVGYRPPADLAFPTYTDGVAQGFVFVDDTGDVTVFEAGTVTFAALAVVRFSITA